jgi:hypothetical protein
MKQNLPSPESFYQKKKKIIQNKNQTIFFIIFIKY